MAEFNLSPENAEKVVLAACVLHSYIRNDVSVEECVIANRRFITFLLRHNISPFRWEC
jgi:hypothetical protein